MYSNLCLNWGTKELNFHAKHIPQKKKEKKIALT